MPFDEAIFRLYAGFNARDFDAVFEYLSDDIVWANAMEGGYVHGHEGIRDYWTRQWKLIDPHVEPLEVIQSGDDTASVEVQQRVKDMDGKLIADETVTHYFTFTNGLVSKFDVSKTM